MTRWLAGMGWDGEHRRYKQNHLNDNKTSICAEWAMDGTIRHCAPSVSNENKENRRWEEQNQQQQQNTRLWCSVIPSNQYVFKQQVNQNINTNTQPVTLCGQYRRPQMRESGDGRQRVCVHTFLFYTYFCVVRKTNNEHRRGNGSVGRSVWSVRFGLVVCKREMGKTSEREITSTRIVMYSIMAGIH